MKVLSLFCALAAVALAPADTRAQSDDAEPRAVCRSRQPHAPSSHWPGYGIYLGNGLILTASHVPGDFALRSPMSSSQGRTCRRGWSRQGNLESVDLTLLSIDATKLPVRLRMRRMPLCERAPYPGEAVVVAIPEGTARSQGSPSARQFPPSCAGDSTPRSPTSPPPEIPAPGSLTPSTFACSGSSAARFPSFSARGDLARRSPRREISPSTLSRRPSSKLSSRPASHFRLASAPPERRR